MNTSLQLTKTMVAELFCVSRSAVTQSTRTKSIEDDVRGRVIRFLFENRSFNSYQWYPHAQRKMKDLLSLFRQITNKRKAEYSGTGRPSTAVNFTAFKKLVRQIFAQYTKWHDTKWDEAEEQGSPVVTYRGSEVQNILYRINGLIQKAWKVFECSTVPQT